MESWRTFVSLAGQPAGLYWVTWRQFDLDVARSSDNARRLAELQRGMRGAAPDPPGVIRSAYLHVGGTLCQDVMLGAAPPGQVAQCVPGDERAVARFVPDPAALCAEAARRPGTPIR